MKIYILEDDANRMVKFRRELIGHEIVHSETAKEFIQLLDAETERIDVMFLDHDLGGETYVDPSHENTGSEVVRWLLTNRVNVDKIVVHTLNPYAGKRMVYDLTGIYKWVSQVPFIHLNSEVFEVIFDS